MPPYYCPMGRRKFSANGEGTMSWVGATHLAYRAFGIQKVDSASHVRCSLTDSGLESLHLGGYCVWVGSWTRQVIAYPGEENLLSLACESLPGSPSSEPPCRRLNPLTGPCEIASFCRVYILAGSAVVYHSVAASFCA